MTEDIGRLIASVEIAESRCTALEAVIKKLRVETAAYSATAEKLEAQVRELREAVQTAGGGGGTEVSGKRYQSGYDDGFKAGCWAGQRDALSLLPLFRKLRDWLRDWHDGDGSNKDKTCPCPQCTQARELLARAEVLFQSDSESQEGKEESRVL